MKTEVPQIRTGFGYDVHAFTDKKPLILGGEKIPHTHGLEGHSDADVLLHAIADALLGAAALRDIGYHFPDTDPRFKGADSQKLLAEVIALLAEKGFVLGNLDATVCMEKPKLLPFIPKMQENIAQICKVDLDAVSIKATTSEKMGFVGRKEGAAAYCTCLIFKQSN